MGLSGKIFTTGTSCELETVGTVKMYVNLNNNRYPSFLSFSLLFLLSFYQCALFLFFPFILPFPSFLFLHLHTSIPLPLLQASHCLRCSFFSSSFSLRFLLPIFFSFLFFCLGFFFCLFTKFIFFFFSWQCFLSLFHLSFLFWVFSFFLCLPFFSFLFFLRSFLSF